MNGRQIFSTLLVPVILLSQLSILNALPLLAAMNYDYDNDVASRFHRRSVSPGSQESNEGYDSELNSDQGPLAAPFVVVAAEQLRKRDAGRPIRPMRFGKRNNLAFLVDDDLVNPLRRLNA